MCALKTVHFLKTSIFYAVVASLFVLAGCKEQQEQIITTAAGEKEEATLPDGSKVKLNAHSSLAFSPSTWSEEPRVILEGEAFIQVKKGRQLSVNTEQGVAEATGATFNVFAREDLLEAKCMNGKVQVRNSEGSQKTLIKAGEQISIIQDRMQPRHGLEFYPAWFKGESIFKDAPLQQVLNEIERQFGVLIIADSLGEQTFSGKFFHKNLDQALAAVCRKSGLNYNILRDTVEISSK